MLVLLLIPMIAASIGVLAYRGISNSSSVGIIGGADGPTAIYVAQTFNPWYILGGAIAVLLLLLALIGFIVYRKKKRQ
ncbi:LPXTG-motif cell wall-anchored protein/predicted secreted protein with PEP-CTERM sorting signal [Hydrogenoanaerobacterium saccharovorans]|uniref:LPXTG-motif cell wall anchor domain-containing protein/PEP-CTERM protein-sorting domain-containing protein n=1 Tax=Hydrogenoanaerobacterium saccharovorans TaxID=474960 RepID=A0A1H8D4C1_9FIRM|nr:sodium ion-translocating decarboxylase subunit beta [Hydrogenoanaerobacterium saccharovorans]RPF43481.1 LPXTG-motif cell wall-anchored protein/predicted secreted protein with PEP-CTERM sorting signal [Hydrogenoanaerobacterium saccharovorans]SEN02049.1 LPXTG-motif cell wall anchor domain-containing protein/PEP-CTERM protein-sorting domain-containing protein [Hydrogenoanaerobacterium saccharovorans]